MREIWTWTGDALRRESTKEVHELCYMQKTFLCYLHDVFALQHAALSPPLDACTRVLDRWILYWKTCARVRRIALGYSKVPFATADTLFLK